jgi:dUTP pyrophosphatase
MPRCLTEPLKEGAAGYDVYSPSSLTIEPGQRAIVPLDIQATPPTGTYIQIASRSGMSAQRSVDTQADVIDSDYTGNVAIVLHNYGKDVFHINTGDSIAQLLILHNETPDISQMAYTQHTECGDNGFGSTGTATIRTTTNTIQEHHDMPYDIYLSQDPFDQILPIEIMVKGDHETLGMQFQECSQRNRLRLIDMALSTPGSRIPRWRSLLRNSYIITFNGHDIHTNPI